MKSKRWHITHYNQLCHNKGILPSYKALLHPFVSRPVSWVLEKDGRRGDGMFGDSWTSSYSGDKKDMYELYSNHSTDIIYVIKYTLYIYMIYKVYYDIIYKPV